MVTTSLSSSDQARCKQDLLIFNQLERLEAEQPEDLRKHMKHGKDAVWCGGDSNGER